MAVLYLRDVPDVTVEQLRRLAKLRHTSVNAVAVSELVEAARRVENPGLLRQLPALGVDAVDVVASIDEGRHER